MRNWLMRSQVRPRDEKEAAHHDDHGEAEALTPRNTTSAEVTPDALGFGDVLRGLRRKQGDGENPQKVSCSRSLALGKSPHNPLKWANSTAPVMPRTFRMVPQRIPAAGFCS